MLIYLTVFGILASTAAAKGAYLVWSGGGDARFLSATSDYLYNGTAVGLVSKQHPYIGAGTWSWNAAWASNVPQRLEFLDTSLCLTTNRDRLQLGECETADTWLFVQLDDAGVRIQPYASGEIRLRKGKLTAGLCVENTKDAGLQTRVCLPRGHVDAGRQNFFIQCSSDLQ